MNAITPEQYAAAILRLEEKSKEKMEAALAALPPSLSGALPTAQQIADSIRATRGSKTIRTSKPPKESGAVKFAWRWARFHAGHDTTFPTTCDFDLYDWLDEVSGELHAWRKLREERKHVADYLTEAASVAARLCGADPLKGALRWARVL